MLRNSLKFTLNFTKQITLLKCIKLPLITSQRVQYLSISFNKTVEAWIDSLSEENKKRVKFIQIEIALRHAQSKEMPEPESLNVADFNEMLQMSQNRRHKYYQHLCTLKNTGEKNETKKLIAKSILDERLEEDNALGLIEPTSNHIEYGLGKNSLLVKIRRETITKWRNMKLRRAMIYNEPPIIFDCGFCESMSKYEIRDTARQIKMSFSGNRAAIRPFAMHLCNLEEGSLLWHELKRQMRNLNKLPIKIHSTDVTEIFPLGQLVYLSPDSENVMHEFDTNDRYIVGAIVDKGQQLPLTLAKSKRLNIRSVRLPLENYIKFQSQKALTLDQMTKILLEIKRTKNWNEALKHVPKRKIQ